MTQITYHLKTIVLATLLSVCAAGASAGQIVVTSRANCPLGNGHVLNDSMTFEQPASGRWTFLVISDQTGDRGGSKFFAGGYSSSSVYAGGTAASNENWIVAGHHYAWDGMASYFYPTIATTCYGGSGSSWTFNASVPRAAQAAIAAPASVRIGAAADVPAVVRDMVNRAVAEAKHPGAADSKVSLAPASLETGIDALLPQLNSHPSSTKRAPAGANGSPLVGKRIEASELRSARDLGSKAGGIQTTNGWTGNTRVFKTKAGELITLHELDLQASGASVVVVKELVNADVNGQPGRVSTARTADGATTTSLTWIADGRRLELETNAEASTARERLLAIARSLY